MAGTVVDGGDSSVPAPAGPPPPPPPLPPSPLTRSYSLILNSCSATACRSRPIITLTYAQSIDGSIASSPSAPLLLSSPASLRVTHHLRSLHAGILVGIGTVTADDPSLTTRLVPGPSPTPIVVDSRLRIDENRRLLRRQGGGCWLVCNSDGLEGRGLDSRVVTRQTLDELHRAGGGGAGGGGDKWAKLQRLVRAGCIVVVLPRCSPTASPSAGWSSSPHVSLPLLFHTLAPYFASIMIEGGAGIITSCLALLSSPPPALSPSSASAPARPPSPPPIDQVVITIAPTFVGGVKSVSRLLQPQPRLYGLTSEKAGDDVILHALTQPPSAHLHSPLASPLAVTSGASESSTAQSHTLLQQLQSLHASRPLSSLVSKLAAQRVLLYSTVSLPALALLLHLAHLTLPSFSSLLHSPPLLRLWDRTNWRRLLLLSALVLVLQRLLWWRSVSPASPRLEERAMQTIASSSAPLRSTTALPPADPAQPYLLPLPSSPAVHPLFFSASPPPPAAPPLSVSRACQTLAGIKYRRQSLQGNRKPADAADGERKEQ